MGDKDNLSDLKNLFKKENLVAIITCIAFCFLLATYFAGSNMLIKVIYFLIGVSLLITAGFVLKKVQIEKKQTKLKYDLKIKFDSSLIFLILTNLMVLFLAVTQQWNYPILFFIYWCQSVTIGLFNIIKFLNLKNIKKEDIILNGGTLKKARVNGTIFFAYGFVLLHGVYLAFILRELKPNFIPLILIILSIFAFFINHLFSFIKNFKHDTEKEQSMIKFALMPFARTMPMHLVIFLGIILEENIGMILQENIAIIVFLFLKTFVDVLMHDWEHRR